MRATVRTFATERFPGSAPDRRALAAQLEDACGDLFGQLTALGTAQSAVQGAADDQLRAVAWGAWTAGLREVFSAADRGWEQLGALIATVPPTKHPAWRSSPQPRKER